MSVNSSTNSSSSHQSHDSLKKCIYTFTSLFIVYILLLPLFILVLYLGYQRWRRQHSVATATTTSHSDVFTFHMVVLELLGILGSSFYCYGIYTNQREEMSYGLHVYFIVSPGQTLFHLLTCVDRYLAVVHPVTYLRLRQAGGVRIRNVSIGLSVLCVLIRPGPGEVGGNRRQVDQSKQRAFHTISVIMAVLLLRLFSILLNAAMYTLAVWCYRCCFCTEQENYRAVNAALCQPDNYRAVNAALRRPDNYRAVNAALRRPDNYRAVNAALRRPDNYRAVNAALRRPDNYRAVNAALRRPENYRAVNAALRRPENYRAVNAALCQPENGVRACKRLLTEL
ncbi:hypothetical protein GBF38_004938 [Nibea albiflora]|uniref:Uncharacterized protein n=1 Tax=Nibea albiflora TaxID=240163 RepID=A0ACB7EVM4_NIBAL|nr:hypothetical protein GBF38_004938 [Nibea albiflora]